MNNNVNNIHPGQQIFDSLLNEIRIYAAGQGNIYNDKMNIANSFLQQQELLERIPSAEMFMNKLSEMGFECTSDIIEYTLKDNIIGWND